MAKGTEQRQLVWEELKSSRAQGRIFKLDWKVHRTKVPGGGLAEQGRLRKRSPT